MTAEQRDRIEELVGPRLRTGENYADAIERIIRELDVARYDRAVVESVKRDRRELETMFAAAIMSTPDCKIRVHSIALHAYSPSRDHIARVRDMATDEEIFYVIRGK